MSKQFIYTTAIKKIRQMTARIKIIPGGSSAGKTFSILPILIDFAIKNPQTSISVVSESLPHLKRGALRDFINIMKLTNRYIDKNWNRSNNIYNFTNGSYIEFFGVEDDSKLRGARRNVLYINEANNIGEESYTQLAMRTDGSIYLDYNPSHKFWIDNVKNSGEAEELILTYRDNEALSPNVIKFLESKRLLAETSDYWANWCNVYLDGLEGIVEGTIFNNWKIIDTIPNQAELLGFGMDFGFTNDPSSMVALYKYNGELIVDEVIYQKGLSNKEISDKIKDNNIIGDIVADSAEPKSISELKSYGHRVLPAKKGADSINYGISLILQQPLNITKRSNNLKNELEKYSWKKDSNGNTLNTPTGPDHALDALRYIVMAKMGNKPKGNFDFSFINI